MQGRKGSAPGIPTRTVVNDARTHTHPAEGYARPYEKVPNEHWEAEMQVYTVQDLCVCSALAQRSEGTIMRV